MYYIRGAFGKFPKGVASHDIDKANLVEKFSEGLTRDGTPFTTQKQGDDIQFLNEFGAVFATVSKKLSA